MPDKVNTPGNPLRVAVVEDDHTVRAVLEILLGGSPGFTCAAAYCNGEDAVAGLPEANPDVVLMDINLPGISGIECITRLKSQGFSAPFIMLTVFENSETVFQSLSAGASGYLLKQTPPAKLLDAILEVYHGGSPMSREIARKVVQSFRQPAANPAIENGLTAREEEILSYLSKGLLYKEIAGKLFIDVETVKTHIRHIYEKLQVHTRSEAIVKYLGK
ncbi:MAG: response regulator transcription factor [Bacteroidales bacterium]|jgi:DNA-binding NarL/FixJ family response regulator|nr:response regulator transcription factor [Bacteroidales bacterium]